MRDDEKIITINTLRSAGKRKLQALFWEKKDPRKLNASHVLLILVIALIHVNITCFSRLLPYFLGLCIKSTCLFPIIIVV